MDFIMVLVFWKCKERLLKDIGTMVFIKNDFIYLFILNDNELNKIISIIH